MKKTAVAFLAMLFALLALLLPACGSGGPTGGCTVDCSSLSTGRIDVRNYGYVTKGDCTDMGKSAGCSTKWCDYACDNPCCVSVN